MKEEKLLKSKKTKKILAISFTMAWGLFSIIFLISSVQMNNWMLLNHPDVYNSENPYAYEHIITPYDTIISMSFFFGITAFILMSIFWILFWIAKSKINVLEEVKENGK